MPIKPQRIQRFRETYEKHLLAAVKSHPEEYIYGPADVPDVADRMTDALAAGSGHKDSAAIRKTCRELAIPHTYKAIRAYFEA